MTSYCLGAEGARVEVTSRLYFLGAGFSRAAGLPLASELLDEILEIARLELRVDGFSHLEDALSRYLKYLLDTIGNEVIDLEQFGAWLDWHHTLQLSGSDTFSEFGSESSLQLKWAIGKVLQERTPSQLPSVYLDFAKSLNSSDSIITLNYDLVLEKSLEAVGLPYRRFPDRFSEVFDSHAVIDTEQPEEVVIRKLHGSMDWSYLWGDSIKPILKVRPLTEGPRLEDDPLRQIGVIESEHLASYYNDNRSFYSNPPLLLPPSIAKPLARSPLIPLWRGIGRDAGWLAGFTMIGCALPPGDPYVKQLIYELATQYSEAKNVVLPWPKQRMKVVDYKTTPDEELAFKRSLSFFDTEYTDFLLGGFASETLEAVFSRK